MTQEKKKQNDFSNIDEHIDELNEGFDNQDKINVNNKTKELDENPINTVKSNNKLEIKHNNEEGIVEIKSEKDDIKKDMDKELKSWRKWQNIVSQIVIIVFLL